MKKLSFTVAAVATAMLAACAFNALHTKTDAGALSVKESYFFKCTPDDFGQRCEINAPVLDGSGRLQCATRWVRESGAHLILDEGELADPFDSYKTEYHGGLQRIYLRSVTTESRAVITITVEGVSVSVVDHDGKPVMIGSNL